MRRALALLALLPVTAGAQLTDWQRVELRDPMGDGKAIAFTASSSERYPGAIRKDAPSLVIGCSKKRPKFIIVAEVQLQPDHSLEYGQRGARIKLDDAKPIRTTGRETTSGDAIHLGDPASWIKRMAGAKRALVEVTPYRHGPSVVTFMVSGLNVHAKEIAEHCGIQLPK